MAYTQPVDPANRLLATLPRQERDRLLAHCEPVELTFTEVLYRAGELIAHVYLPNESFIALMTPINRSTGLEVGLIGNEGMLGMTLMLGAEVAPFDALVQGPGSALRIAAASFLRALEQSPALQTLLKRYLYVSMSQLAQAAVCHRFHVLEARLARWLLMNQDRAHADTFHITHVSMAAMLGVRRVGITKAANSLQKQQLISY
ncbi:MAG: Crp/Fnr family transcriptional regulator, partial [Halobacteriota archaeon]